MRNKIIKQRIIKYIVYIFKAKILLNLEVKILPDTDSAKYL